MRTPDQMDTKEIILPFDDLGINQPVPFSSRIQIDFGGLSDIGKVRDNNEDAFLIFRMGRYWRKMLTNLSESILPEKHEECGYAMAVADGMGGLAAGEVASSMALSTVVNLVLTSVKWALTLDHPERRAQEIQESINRGVDYLCKADQAISRRGEQDSALQGMGTTLTAGYSFGDDFFLFHVGDSRAYLFRSGKLKQLTRDHTIAQALADMGDIKQEEVSSHQFKHVLTRAIGRNGGKLDVEIHQIKLLDGDQVLLCSDGLSDMITDRQISDTLSQPGSAQDKCKALVDLALLNGGRDNVTVLIASYQIPERE